jgi:hypothetical protein
MEENKTIPLRIFNFDMSIEPPINRFTKKGEYRFLSWGENNVYPELLLSLYEAKGSPLHKSCINKKVKLSAGFGLKDIISPELLSYVEDTDLELLFRFISRDFEIFNGFSFEVIWNREGTKAKLHYVPIHTLRFGLDETGKEVSDYMWYSKNWGDFRKKEYEPVYIKRYEPEIRNEKTIYYYTEPNANGFDYYPSPSYSTGLNYISLDYEISQYHKNSLAQGFQPSFMMYFATGIPEKEEQDLFHRQFMKNFQGAQNAGKILLSWGSGSEEKPEMIKIDNAVNDDRFILLRETIEMAICQSAEMPPQLVLVSPGSLASQDERKELLQEFQLYYIEDRQKQLEKCVNSVLKTMGFTEKVELRTYMDTEVFKTNLEQPQDIQANNNNI